MAKVGLDEAKREEIMAKAKALQIKTKGDALNVAELIEILLPLAPAADRLLSTQQTPEETAHAAA